MKENEQKILVAGVDGSKGGWVCVSGNLNSNDNTKFDIFNHFEEIIEKKFSLILVDMPIGLDEELMKGGRVVDREARGMLLKNKSSIFNPPSRLALKAKDYQDALSISNDTEFGLTSGIVTNSLKFANHFKRHSNSGCVMVNLPTAGTDYHVPFGGRKASSYGPREQGQYAKEFFTVVKTTYISS